MKEEFFVKNRNLLKKLASGQVVISVFIVSYFILFQYIKYKSKSYTYGEIDLLVVTLTSLPILYFTYFTLKWKGVEEDLKTKRHNIYLQSIKQFKNVKIPERNYPSSCYDNERYDVYFNSYIIVIFVKSKSDGNFENAIEIYWFDKNKSDYLTEEYNFHLKISSRIVNYNLEPTIERSLQNGPTFLNELYEKR